MKMSHRKLLFLSGMLWLAIGAILLSVGLNLFLSAVKTGDSHAPLLHFFSSLSVGKENGAVLLIAAGLLVGRMKGKHVLKKSACRVINRLLALPDPTSITNLYSLPYYLLIASMMLLGMAMRWFQVPLDIRGFIDVAVGAALIHGASTYFQQARSSVSH